MATVLPYQRIVVTGADGQLGTELVRRWSENCIPITIADCDFRNQSEIGPAIIRQEPDIIVNCAAYTAVDKAESDETACFDINAAAVETLARISNELAIPLVQISTDYVFGADSQRRTPYTEDDQPGPLGVYGRSKLAGEHAAAIARNHLIVRTCGLYSKHPDGPIRGRNFCDTMLSLGRAGTPLRVVNDQYCTPTYVPTLASMLEQLIARDACGLVHATAAESCTWYQLALEIFEAAKLEVELTPIPTEQYPTPAPRPRFSVLDCGAFGQMTGSTAESWREGIKKYCA